MSTEYKLSFTASEIDEKLRKVDQLSTEKEVAVQNNQPTSSTLWIDTDSTDEINLAEIDDNTVSDEKTWSSTKISDEIVDKAEKTEIPTKVSQLQNDMGYAKPSDMPTIVQEAGESETLIMSQKAVTQLVNDALGNQSEYETVTSVDQMTDKSKSYILASTGTVWTYGETYVEVEPQNKFVRSEAKVNTRLDSSNTEAAYTGMYLTNYMEFDGSTAKSTIVWLPLDYPDMPDGGNQRIAFVDSSKTKIVVKYIWSESASSNMIYTAYDEDKKRYFIDMSTCINGDTIDLSNVKYVRFCFMTSKGSTSITASDIANVEILFENDRTTSVVNDWYDTKMSGESASSGGNYVDLLVKVNQNTSDISELEKQVANLSSGNENLTIPTFWESAVNEAITKIKALQVGRNCITFPFFSDNHQRNGYVGLLTAYIMKECNIPYCFFGGDSISNGYIDSEATMIAQDKAFDTIMSYIPNGRFCRAVGNHDGYWAVSSTEKYTYTRNQVYELFLREESIAQNKHFGDDGTYYYVDDLASKVRFIVMNTNGGSVDSTQISWLQNNALSFNESGWGVVFISHQPISNHYHALISNAQEVINIVKNYINGTSTNKADVIGWFSGHIHRDRIYTGIATNTSDDTQGTAMGFTQVTITSDHTSIAYDDTTKHAVANDDKSHAIDFVTINKSTRQVNITRLGIGNDRSYTY